MSKTNDWTIITVAYNSADALQRYWSATKLPENVRWIVVDNASSDGSADTAARLGAEVIRLSQNIGFGAANNAGFKRATSEYVAFINPDVQVVPSDFEALASEVETGPDALISPQLRNLDGSLQPNGRMEPYLIFKVLNRLAPKLVENRYTRVFENSESGSVTWLTGAVIATKRSIFEQLGGWDDLFFVYYEDTDLGLRAKNENIESKVIGRINWTHGWARDASGFNFTAWKLELSSAFKFYRRYPRFLLIPSLRTKVEK